MRQKSRQVGLIVLASICICVSSGAQQQNSYACETVRSILADASAIRSGMSRAELEEKFVPASFTFRTSATYVSRKCAYVAVDVEFDTNGSPDGHAKPEDKIVKISRPYLAMPSKD